MKIEDRYNAFLSGLYVEHFSSLWGYAYHLAKNADTADDIVHTVFLNIIKHAEKLLQIGDKNRIKAYLNAAVRNAYRNYAKKEARQPLVADFDAICNIPCGFRVDDEVIAAETAQAAWNSLTTWQQELLVLSCYVGFSHKQISELTGLTNGNVRVSLFRAKLAIKSYLKLGGHDEKGTKNGQANSLSGRGSRKTDGG